MFEASRGSTPAPKHGVWTLSAAGVTLSEAAADGVPVVLVPAEQVTILTVDLPLANSRQRLAALPFAVEELIAQPLDAVHIALGAEVAPRRHLAGVVRRDVMQGWVAQLAAAGFDRCVMMPEALALPAPAPGGWTVGFSDRRVLVRTEDSAFAIAAGQFRALWAGQGAPPLTAYGDAAPPLDLAADVAMPSATAPARRLHPPPLDLLQGAFAAGRAPASPALRRFAAVVAFAVFAHTLIAGVGTAALQRTADARRADVAMLLQIAAPGVPLDEGLIDRLGRLSNAGAEPGGFLPLMVRASQAMAPLGGEVALQGLTYAQEDAALALRVTAPDLAGLQRAQAALTDAGLQPVSGAASSDAGRAEGEITVRDISAGAPR